MPYVADEHLWQHLTCTTCVCLICAPELYALYLCLVFMPCIYALYVCLIYYMHDLYVCIVCQPDVMAYVMAYVTVEDLGQHCGHGHQGQYRMCSLTIECVLLL